MRFNKFTLSILLVMSVVIIAASAVVARKRAGETIWKSTVRTSVKLSVVRDENEVSISNTTDYATFVIIAPSGARHVTTRSSGFASVIFPDDFGVGSKAEAGRYKWMCFVNDRAVANGQFDFQPTDTVNNQSLTGYEIEQERLRLVEQRVSAISRAQIGTGRNDEWIWTKVRAALASVDGLRDSTIDVAVDNSVVTLSGSVPEAAQKEKAGIVVRSIEGVKSLRNMLIISQ